MRVTTEAWESITQIINREFVFTGQELTPKLLRKLIKEVAEEYTEENPE